MSNPEIKNVHVRQRSDGIYEVAWTEDGKPKRRSTGKKQKRAANVALAQIEADIRAPRVPDAPTIGWLIEAYQRSLAATKPAHSVATINSSLRPVKARLGNLRWDQLTQERIDEYAAARLTDKRWADHPRKRTTSDKTIGPSTVDRDLRMLRAALRAAHAARHIPHEVQFKINVTPSAPRKVWLTKAEVGKLLDACEPRRELGNHGRVTYRMRDREHLYTFILLSIATAARKEAILSLTWDQIHFPTDAELNGEKLVDLKTGKVAGNTYVDFGAGTANKRRPVMPIGDNFRLMWQLVTMRPAPSTYDVHEGDDTENRVITFNGKPIADVKNGIRTLCKECGITKQVTPHTFKHTSITWMVQAGMPLSTISDLTNTSEKILRKVYSHHRPDYQAELGSALSV